MQEKNKAKDADLPRGVLPPEAGTAYAVALGTPGSTWAGPVDVILSEARMVVLDSVTGRERWVSGFGAWPVGPNDDVLPMRIEFSYGEPGPVTAVFDLDGGLVGRFEYDLPGDTPWRLTIEPADESDPTASGLRRFNLGRALGQLDEWLRHPLVVRVRGGDVSQIPRRRPGRRGSDPLTYATIAADYVRALGVNPTEPAAVLVREATERGEYLTLTDVRNRVRRARALGLLSPPPERGRAGGTLTERAVELLVSEGLAHLIPQELED